MASAPSRYLAFRGSRRLAAGSLETAAAAARSALASGGLEPVLVLDAETGAVVDIDPRGAAQAAPPPPRGRPRLGVVAREVTLLPRHWDWLAAQPGGASGALRRLIDTARKSDADATLRRQRRDAAYRLMSVLAGDLPGFEEAARALFAGEDEAFRARIAAWPTDVVAELSRMTARDPGGDSRPAPSSET